MTPLQRAEADRIEHDHPRWTITEHAYGHSVLFCAEPSPVIHLMAPDLAGVERSIIAAPEERAA